MFVWSAFCECGPTGPDLNRLTFTEATAYISTLPYSEGWEARILVLMSRNYLDGLALGGNLLTDVQATKVLDEPLFVTLLEEGF